MSTGLECEFFEYKDNWYYVLQDWNCPKGAWDWREWATCYGPFASYDEAHDHLRDNHANPGGHSITEGAQGEVYDRLVAEAEPPKDTRFVYIQPSQSPLRPMSIETVQKLLERYRNL